MIKETLNSLTAEEKARMLPLIQACLDSIFMSIILAFHNIYIMYLVPT